MGGLAGLAGCDRPLDLRVHPDKTVYRAGEPIVGTIVLKNRGSHSVTARFSSSCLWHITILRKGSGEMVQMSDLACFQMMTELQLDGGEEVVLASGVLHSTQCENTSFLCEPLTPGRYLLRVRASNYNHNAPEESIPIEIVDVSASSMRRTY